MKNAQIIKRIIIILLSFSIILSLAACGNKDEGAVSEDGNESSEIPKPADDKTSEKDKNEESERDEKKILVVYFSHTGENYSVGAIEKGNTHIIAEMIAEETGADLFEIKPTNPYPDDYDECADMAKKERNENARPEIENPPKNLDEYDTIFIGYPIWWGDMPMAVYTFLESYDFSGKTIIPFCTHEGSGLAETEESVKKNCSGANVLGGLAIRGSIAQNEREKAKSEVLKWLDGLEI